MWLHGSSTGKMTNFSLLFSQHILQSRRKQFFDLAVRSDTPFQRLKQVLAFRKRRIRCQSSWSWKRFTKVLAAMGSDYIFASWYIYVFTFFSCWYIYWMVWIAFCRLGFSCVNVRDHSFSEHELWCLWSFISRFSLWYLSFLKTLASIVDKPPFAVVSYICNLAEEGEEIGIQPWSCAGQHIILLETRFTNVNNQRADLLDLLNIMPCLILVRACLTKFFRSWFLFIRLSNVFVLSTAMNHGDSMWISRSISIHD